MAGRVRLGRWVTGDSRVRRERQWRRERGDVSKGEGMEGDSKCEGDTTGEKRRVTMFPGETNRKRG